MTIRELNNDPLNQAAFERLRREQLGPDDREMYLLQLAQLGLENGCGEPAADDDPRRKVVDDYSRGVRLQQSALMCLEEVLDPDDLQKMPLEKLADHISCSLLAESSPHDDPAQKSPNLERSADTKGHCGTGATATEQTIRPDPSSSSTIAVVGSEPAVVDAIQQGILWFLKDVKVLTFQDSRCAWQELSANKPNLAFVANSMPWLNGTELVDRFLDDHATFPIIVFSSWGPIRDWVQKRRARGANVSYLEQPFTLEDLRLALEGALLIRLSGPSQGAKPEDTESRAGSARGGSRSAAESA